MANLTLVVESADPTIPTRKAILEAWLAAAQEVATVSRDSEALSVAQFLHDRATVGLPRAQSDLAYLPRPGLDQNQTLIIVPMLTVDYFLLPADDYWRRFASPDQGQDESAEFYVPTRAIYVSGEWPRAARQVGLLLLHEGLHAYDHLIRGQHMPKPFWRRERNAHFMESRVLKTLGGVEFVAYLDSLASEVDRQLKASRGKAIDLPAELMDNALLDRILWPAPSRPERRERIFDVERCAVIRFFEQRHGLRAGRALYGKYIRDNYIGEPHPQHLAGLVRQRQIVM